MDQYIPELWPPWLWWTLRTMASLSAWRARRGSSSEIWMPETLVAIGLNSPRTVSGAWGFMSQRSMWLGAPQLKMRMTAFALPRARFSPVAASALAQPFQNVLRPPRAPRPRNCRRVVVAAKGDGEGIGGVPLGRIE